MRIFEIKNEYQNDLLIGYLLYYEKEKKFFIEINKDVERKKLPILLRLYQERKGNSLDSYWSYYWIKERIVPSDRQNIADIIKESKETKYDEFKLLLWNEGRCSQDECYIREIKEIPELLKQKYKYQIDNIMPCDNNNILVAFKDGIVKKVNILSLNMIDDTLRYLLESRPDYFYKVNLDINGNGIYWEDYMYVHCMDLYNNGEFINLNINDFKKIFEHTIINTKEACDILSCSRQYIDKLVKTGKIKPIKEIDKTRLFLKSDIAKIRL